MLTVHSSLMYYLLELGQLCAALQTTRRERRTKNKEQVRIIELHHHEHNPSNLQGTPCTGTCQRRSESVIVRNIHWRVLFHPSTGPTHFSRARFILDPLAMQRRFKVSSLGLAQVILASPCYELSLITQESCRGPTRGRRPLFGSEQ